MFKVLDKVCEPQRGTKYSSSVDLFARESVTIEAGETKRIPLGVKIDLKKLKLNLFFYKTNTLFGIIFKKFIFIKQIDNFLKSHFLELKIRSSLAEKGLIITNGSGEIDLDYPKEICLLVHNPIKSNEILNYIRFAQGLNDESQINTDIKIKKGDKVAQIKLMEHKSYLMGYESDKVREDGFGSTGDKR